MAAKLSQLTKLVERVRDGSDDARAALLRDLLELYLAQPNALTPATREEFGAIMAALASQTNEAARREIASMLIASPAAPHALLTALARAESNIAAPVLRQAVGFTDAALIELVKNVDELRLSAIAQRKQVSEPVTDALSAHGETATLIMLVKNQGAAFSPAAMQRVVAAARRKPELQQPLTARFDLPPHLLIRMFFFIAADLRKEILGRAELIDPALVRDAIDSTREALVIGSEQDSAEVSEAQRLVEEKAAAGEINEAFLNDLITAREQASITYAFAWLAGVDARAVRTMFKDASLESLAVACRASRLTRDAFAGLAGAMVKSPQAGQAPMAGKARAPIMLDLYEKISPEIAEKLMRFWRLRARAAADAAKIASLLQGVEGLSVETRKAG